MWQSSIVGVIPAGLFMLLTGGVMSIVTGQYDIPSSSPTWACRSRLAGAGACHLTTNVTNAYSGGLALSNLLGFDESSSRSPRAHCRRGGHLCRAAFGVLGKFEAFST